ncbi:type I-B CRISPR-associated protein Cas7/Cst2/DevR [Brachyspira aalborgi]|jgi:CRISPR-associated protein Cst2|uniref:Type I-B CRISPR-associated protein Cas7/Cst2/DevR n=1 Tax=Brachyspira aalborgi TaxID=29522 RepID=A0AB38Q1E7_9SPIR|nr:type I-B CRISPR-associated protein Cas7/Cst2/DevR [Brachyspira aalborgi]MBS4763075.1 type I-B CRISPR-associated protein Cas7/Cst2/DevR [Brachyspira sp.]CCY75831.1 cRISPR-associated autoregulator DevR family [Brachyspira sp. CAG:700]TXJ14311.1 type I-B CRISPR-associated protein Cas7/Cst2/DevR [Brachyspira aalborgi]TXJ19089.1 type I-B CRISPR-associated protein Cas7/Cst2/DevR [Brachyspira aalborgi]TXJ25215.1 type I-B CRISPR-associated protein Cas7/Cst2/DevR [Brachyspira aalborgi]
MENKGLTLSIIFEAESANYGEGFGNISSLKKMSRGNGYSYSYISRQALGYNIRKQLKWNNTPVSDKDKVVQHDKDASIKDYPEIDLFGYMKTGKNSINGTSNTRVATVRLSNAIALENYNSDLDFLTNMALAKRGNFENMIAQSEIHKSYYAYTVTIDLDRVGIDEVITEYVNGEEPKKEKIEIDKSERAKRVNDLLKILKTLYRDIRGRRENLTPIFIIGGVYNIKNPFFENRLRVSKNNLDIDIILNTIDIDKEVKNNTVVGYIGNIFNNSKEIEEELKTKSIPEVFDYLSEEVNKYYGK